MNGGRSCASVMLDKPHQEWVVPLFRATTERKLDRTGASNMEKISAPSKANATVHAIGLKRRPSTACSVKIGRYAVMMMPIA